MTSPNPDEPLHALSGSVQLSWQRFLDVYEPQRSALYRYCRYLTRSPWDAEDLAQDALARAFATLGRMGQPPPNPRAWLFRVASNLWIDQLRRTREGAAVALETGAHVEPRAAREAAGTLIEQLAPQERAAVVLKDVFDLTLEEIAEALSTSVGAIKSALHRGRGKLILPEPAIQAPPTPAVIDAFCAAFNARDIDRLTALLLDTASIEVVGVTTQYGPEAARSGIFHGMLYGSQRLAAADTQGGIEARFMQGVLPASPRCEVREHRGETLLLLWYAHADGEAVRSVNRVELAGDQIARLQNYFFTPDFIADVCGELGVPHRINGYRYWLTGCEA